MDTRPQHPTQYDLEVDVLVIGGGMSGLTAAAHAAGDGAEVLVVEKAPATGGSAALALGFFWTARTTADLLNENPGADPALAELLVSRFDDALDWIRASGVEVRDRMDLETVMGFPTHGHLFDNLGYLARCARTVTANGGHIIPESTVDSLILRDGAVDGAMVTDGDSTFSVRATSTVLATGGIQGSPALRKKYIGDNGDRILLRANPCSTGDGLTLALSAGASTSRHMDGFYGHLVPSPLVDGLDPADYAKLSMMFSPRCMLVNSSGTRWMDESRGYFVNAQEVARLPDQRALLIGDQQIRDDDGLSFGNSEQSDRIDTAIARGARVTVEASLGDLADTVREWGYDISPDVVSEFNSLVGTDRGTTAGEPPHRRFRGALTRPPYFAVEVQPTITFSHGGIGVDTDCRVLGQDGAPVPGLLAAGVDTGGTFHGGYAGGLAMSTVTGLTAARTALRDLSREPSQA
jgi:succinate dehydrogenase/fumarate reductase flavoprotein subunit